MREILVEHNGDVYEHGCIEFNILDEFEANVTLDAHATIVRVDMDKFCEEITKVFQKYAI